MLSYDVGSSVCTLHEKENKMKPEVTKLPKWAQEHIQTIERQRDFATKTLDDFINTQTPSDFFVDEFSQKGTIKHYIQTRKITVKLDNGKEIYINKEQDGSFYLASGWGGLQIEPSASNAIRIKVKQ